MEPGAGQPPEGSEQDRPRMRNPTTDPDSAPEKQSELKLNVGIGVIGTILSLFVTVIFFFLLEEPSPVLGILFGVITVVSLVVTLYAASRKRKARS